MKYLEVKPHPILRNYIKCFWYLERDYAANPLSSEIILPDGSVDFVFQIDENSLYTKSDHDLVRQPFGFLIGHQKQPVQLTAAGKNVTAGIRFFAYGAYPFLQIPIHKLQEPTTGLDDLLGKNIRELVEKVQGLSVDRIFEEFEKFLIISLHSFKVNIEPIKIATELLFQNRGFVDISKLALEVNLSTRNLERKFDEIIGVSPKALARVIRFDNLKNELILTPQTSLTDLAFRYGYFDQAHFIHDFKNFAGQTPSAFKRDVANQQIYFYK